jgi:aminoglycoside phosphotransferase (APT) family kinase protein
VSLFTRNDIPPSLSRHVPLGVNLVYPAQGMTSEVAFVDGQTRCVIKRCRDPIYVEWLRREHRVLRELAASRLSIPRVLDYFEVNADNRSEVWLVMSHLDGRSLRDEMLGANVQQRVELFWWLGGLLSQLHSTRVPNGLIATSPWTDRQLVKAEHNLSWCDGTPDLLADRRRPPPIPEVLIHGDLALDNVLIAPDGTLSLIDWSSGDMGDPRCDLSLSLQTEPETPLTDADRLSFFEGYGTAPLDKVTRRWFEDLYEFF